MSTPPLSDDTIRATVAAMQGRSQAKAAKHLGIARQTLQARLKAARERGITAPGPTAAPVEKPRVRVRAGSDAVPANLPDLVLAAIRGRARHAVEIATHLKVSEADVKSALRALEANHVRLEQEHDGRWGVSKDGPRPAWLAGPLHSFVTGPDNTITFGASGDQHMGSKYERLDVLDSLYDAFADAGCDTVFNTGNWIDGEARFNKHDLHTHGMDAQVRHLVAEYPKRAGIKTYAVTGDDHEGWYAQREGVDIGRYAERSFRDAGRDDWTDLGYMEAPVRIVNANTGKELIMAVVHPGGGSSYALSYSIQKIIESLDGGEKPAVGLYGHYHKLWYGNIRNVWCVQTGCTEDQTPFMRKKKLEAHVGGAIVKLTQDPATGAITRCQVELLRYFNRGYYANRWSHHGPVKQGERISAGLAA